MTNDKDPANTAAPHTDELGATITPSVPAASPSDPSPRTIAAESRALLSENPAFIQACRDVTQGYMTEFLSLKRNDPDFEKKLIRCHASCNCIGDIITQLQLCADHKKFEAAMALKTMKGD